MEEVSSKLAIWNTEAYKRLSITKNYVKAYNKLLPSSYQIFV